MKFDICVFGGCSLDATYFQKSDLSYADEADIIEPGGKGANQAVAAARAGAKVVMLTRLGNDDVGKLIKENLKKNNVNVDFVEMIDNLNNDYSKIFVRKSDGANEIERQTGAIDSFYPGLVYKYKDIILNSKYVLAQMKAPKEFSIELINFCHQNDVNIIITPCRPQKLSIKDHGNLELLNKIDYITCNQEECEIIFGTKNIKECVTKYPNKLIVTLGIDGVLYHDGEKVVNIPAIKELVAVDSTGAGDTFCGNFAACLVNGLSIKEAITRAQFASQMQIQAKGAQKGMPYFHELDQFIHNQK